MLSSLILKKIILVKSISMEDYLKINRQTWNKEVPVHVESAFYDNKAFIEGKSSLNEIELSLLDKINGSSVLHLQCHFGQDTISLDRLGARALGVDFSEKAIDAAEQLAAKTNSSARFLCSDIYQLPEVLEDKFDVVYTTYGTIGWLPDIKRWANVVAHFLKPGGELIFVEFHPVVWMFDDSFQEIKYAYFKKDEIIETEEVTYADQQTPLKQETVTWNHGLAEVIGALLDEGLVLEFFDEYDYSPYDCFSGTVEVEPGKFRIKALDDKLPMVYTLKARKV